MGQSPTLTAKAKLTVCVYFSIKKIFKGRNLLKETKKDIILLKKWSKHHDDITILKIYTPGNKDPKYMKQILTELMVERILLQ